MDNKQIEEKLLLNFIKYYISEDAFNVCLNNVNDYKFINHINSEYKRTPLSFDKNKLVESIVCEDNDQTKIITIIKYLASDKYPHIRNSLTNVIVGKENIAPTDNNIISQHINNFKDEISMLVPKTSVICVCGSYNTISKSKQTRSCDEAETTIVTCIDCGLTSSDEGVKFGQCK